MISSSASDTIYLSVAAYVALLEEQGNHETARRVREQAGPDDIIEIANGEAVLVDYREAGH